MRFMEFFSIRHSLILYLTVSSLILSKISSGLVGDVHTSRTQRIPVCRSIAITTAAGLPVKAGSNTTTRHHSSLWIDQSPVPRGHLSPAPLERRTGPHGIQAILARLSPHPSRQGNRSTVGLRPEGTHLLSIIIELKHGRLRQVSPRRLLITVVLTLDDLTVQIHRCKPGTDQQHLRTVR